MLEHEERKFYDAAGNIMSSINAARIVALIDIPRHNVKAGDMGGFITGERCLSHNDDAWVGGDALVSYRSSQKKNYSSVVGKALVTDDAVVIDSRVEEKAIVSGSSFVQNSLVSGQSSIEENARVVGSEVQYKAKVVGNAVVRRSLIEANATVLGDSVVGSSLLTGDATVGDKAVVSSSALRGEVFVYENAVVNNSHLLDTVRVTGRANIQGSFITGTTEITDAVMVETGCYIEGRSFLSGKLEVPRGSHIRSEKVHGDFSLRTYERKNTQDPVAVDPVRPHNPGFGFVDPPVVSRPIEKQVEPYVHKLPAKVSPVTTIHVPLQLKKSLSARIKDYLFAPEESKEQSQMYAEEMARQAWEKAKAQHALSHEQALLLQEKVNAVTAINADPVNDELQALITVVNDIEKAYNEYTTDVVKLIQFPLMTDTSVPEVEDFVIALRRAKRSLLSKQVSKISSDVDQLERTFIKAENAVLTARQSTLSAEKRKKLQTAENMFALAFDKHAPLPEKKTSMKAGLRSLEGIVYISDEASKVIHARAGLLAIEA
jgi:carbonic anhydrase/acetyltransferase-like protein (isoleucine patch superfamily)